MKIKILSLNNSPEEQRENKFGKKYYIDRFSCEDEAKKTYSKCSYFNYSDHRTKAGDLLVGDITEDKEYNGEMTYMFKKAKAPNPFTMGGGGGISKDAMKDVAEAISGVAFSNVFSTIFNYYMKELNGVKEKMTTKQKVDIIAKKAKEILDKEQTCTQMKT